MSITAVVTNHNYGRYLAQCLESASRFCDEVLLYDDGSTDDSLEIAKREYVRVIHRDDCTGGPVWGSNRGIEDATSTHLIYLDADNFMLRRPEVTTDYTFADIYLADEGGAINGLWEYGYWPLTASECLAKYKRELCIPVPWGGVWSVDFLRSRSLHWIEWPSSSHSADFRTCIDWLTHDPTISYQQQPWLAFRVHDGQESMIPERREAMMRDAAALAATM